ncbi:CPS_HP_G0068160.mRNA.1.CDS.1 [Saccharomyces cerevisiae]|nr:CPS_HP_G0058580.mRNA.1.CDS.1 [Saccharomyces cerevisiae]CAI4990955.1 CPS_HP_G0068160.mRNA.1.CDS.1 [Saccharomyces cerevisiae]CAI6803474.1 CPS_HP_G0058580.mRNA.1.CDS.1 [Saccharomyces cerevisiae]CAI6863768.1 CPS_HP_G0068160.mRNA.1.CDS.1 [Saccharomyces cerevisiae]CAI7390408.1 CPS_collapsed_G0037270.mRNA.1.CDS.1 [Saccharomyces cerevisiae]
MWSSLFGWTSSNAKNKESPTKAIVRLREHINLLSKKQSHLRTQITNQENEARIFLTKDNKVMAKNALKKKKTIEQLLSKVEGTMESMEQQLFSIESANLNLETMRAMQEGAKAMKTIHSGLDIDKVDETMDEIREQVELGDEISDAISRPLITGANEVDEDELDEELDMLAQENANQETSKIVNNNVNAAPISENKVSLPSVPSNKIKQSENSVKDGEEEEDEEDEDEKALRELQAEMGL